MTYYLTVIESSSDGRDSVMINSMVWDDGRVEIIEILQPSPILIFPKCWGREMVWRRDVKESWIDSIDGPTLSVVGERSYE